MHDAVEEAPVADDKDKDRKDARSSHRENMKIRRTGPFASSSHRFNRGLRSYFEAGSACYNASLRPEAVAHETRGHLPIAAVQCSEALATLAPFMQSRPVLHQGPTAWP